MSYFDKLCNFGNGKIRTTFWVAAVVAAMYWL